MIKQALETLKESKIDVVGHYIMGHQFTHIQFAIMLALIRANEDIVTRKEMREFIKLGKEVTLRTIDAHICRIREKFGTSYNIDPYPIETIHNTGYRIDKRFLEKLKDNGKE